MDSIIITEKALQLKLFDMVLVLISYGKLYNGYSVTMPSHD